MSQVAVEERGSVSNDLAMASGERTELPNHVNNGSERFHRDKPVRCMSNKQRAICMAVFIVVLVAVVVPITLLVRAVGPPKNLVESWR